MPIDINHPIIMASRYADAQAEELGLPEALKQNNIDADTLIYAAQQRALRMVLLVTRGPQVLEDMSRTNPEHVELMPFEQDMMKHFTRSSLDGIFIGWKAANIERQEQ